MTRLTGRISILLLALAVGGGLTALVIARFIPPGPQLAYIHLYLNEPTIQTDLVLWDMQRALTFTLIRDGNLNFPEPVSWSPDGAHLLVYTDPGDVQPRAAIVEASGDVITRFDVDTTLRPTWRGPGTLGCTGIGANQGYLAAAIPLDAWSASGCEDLSTGSGPVITSGAVVSWSRTGRVAFVDPLGGDLVSMRADGGDIVTHFDLDAERARVNALSRLPAPVWSPGGRYLSVQADTPDAEAGPDLLIVDTQTGRNWLINEAASISWSPDEQAFVYHKLLMGPRSSPARNTVYSYDVHRFDLRDGFITRLASGQTPQWSPDGGWILFQRDQSWYRIRPDGTDERLVFAVDNAALNRMYAPAWRP